MKVKVLGLKPGRTRVGRFVQVIAVCIAVGLLADTAFAERRHKRIRNSSVDFCDQTADILRSACLAGVSDDFAVSSASCINISDSAERRACSREAKHDRRDAHA